MEYAKWCWLVGVVAVLGAPMTQAGESSARDDIMVVDEDQSADDVADLLPERVSDATDEHAVFGQSVAAQASDHARELGREFGQQTSSQVRQNVAHNGASAHRPH